MSRSLKKGPYVEESLLRKVQKMQAAGKKQPIKRSEGASCRERV